MIGLIHGMITLGAGIANAINGAIFDRESKNEAIGNSITGTYHAWNGHDIDIATGRKVYTQRCGYDNFFVRDFRTRKIIRDVYEENKLAEFRAERNIGKRKSIMFADMERLEALWDVLPECQRSRSPKYDDMNQKKYKFVDPAKTYIFAHLKTGRLCYIGDATWHYKTECWKAINADEKGIPSGIPDLIYFNGELPKFYVDIFTGEIVDYVDKEEYKILEMRTYSAPYPHSNFWYYRNGEKIVWDFEALKKIIEVYNNEHLKADKKWFHKTRWEITMLKYREGIKI